MPARPVSDETLQLIAAVRAALAHRSDVDERPLFGTHAFFVDGKFCLAVKNDELLARLPPARHGELLEMQNTRELSPGGGMKGYFWVEPNGYATRAQWRFWVDEALAYNPQAKATPPRGSRKPRSPVATSTDEAPGTGRRTVRPAPADTASVAKKAPKAISPARTAAPAKPKQLGAKPLRQTPAATASRSRRAMPPPRKHSIFEADD